MIMELFNKMQKVSDEIGVISKTIEVGKGLTAYKAVSCDEVLRVINKAELKYGLFSYVKAVRLLGHNVRELINVNNGQKELIYEDTIELTLQITDIENGNHVEVSSLARGLDYWDKGFGKAMTYAKKYALINAYKLRMVDEDDPDLEKSVKKVAQSIDEKRIALTNYLVPRVTEFQNVCSSFGVNDLSELSNKEVEIIFNTFQKKGELC